MTSIQPTASDYPFSKPPETVRADSLEAAQKILGALLCGDNWIGKLKWVLSSYLDAAEVRLTRLLSAQTRPRGNAPARSSGLQIANNRAPLSDDSHRNPSTVSPDSVSNGRADDRVPSDSLGPCQPHRTIPRRTPTTRNIKHRSRESELHGAFHGSDKRRGILDNLESSAVYRDADESEYLLSYLVCAFCV